MNSDISCNFQDCKHCYEGECISSGGVCCDQVPIEADKPAITSGGHTEGKLEAKPSTGDSWVVMIGNAVITKFQRKDFPERNKGNAERMKLCWNAHAPLVEALEQLYDSHKWDACHQGQAGECSVCSRNLKLKEKVEQALALAGGKERT